MLSRDEAQRRRGKIWTVLRNLLRRMAVTSTTALEWKLKGFVDDLGNVERESAEVFGVGGVISRPQAGAKAEAIVAYLGGDSNAPVVLATRDADAVKAFEALAGELEAGETAIVNANGASVRIGADGVVTIISASNIVVEPTYKATTHEVWRKALDTAIASAAAGVGGGVTSAINAARSAFEAAIPTFTTESKLS